MARVPEEAMFAAAAAVAKKKKKVTKGLHRVRSSLAFCYCCGAFVDIVAKCAAFASLCDRKSLCLFMRHPHRLISLNMLARDSCKGWIKKIVISRICTC